MTQAEIDREVSVATGESRGTIRRLGFSLLLPDDALFDDDIQTAPLQIVDWDEQDNIRRRAA